MTNANKTTTKIDAPMFRTSKRSEATAIFLRTTREERYALCGGKRLSVTQREELAQRRERDMADPAVRYTPEELDAMEEDVSLLRNRNLHVGVTLQGVVLSLGLV